MTTVLIYLPQPLKAQLDAARDALGVTNSVIIRTLLRDWLPNLQSGEYPSAKPEPATTHEPSLAGTPLGQSAEPGAIGQHGSTSPPSAGEGFIPDTSEHRLAEAQARGHFEKMIEEPKPVRKQVFL
jgi:hypothetical protein